MLRLSLDASSPRVQIARDKAVPDGLWSALSRNIAPGRTERISDNEIAVPLERLLVRRSWLSQAINRYECSVSASPELTAILERGKREYGELRAGLAGDTRPISEAELDELIGKSRLKRPLMEFQKRDLRTLLGISHGANFSVPGAGKTTVAYATFELERVRGRVDRLLVVAPLSAFEAWGEEAEKCLVPAPMVRQLTNTRPGLAEVLIVNYQRLRSRFDLLAEWMSAGHCHLILDEAHRMKRGHDGQWGAACLELAHFAVRRDILTGTPAPQHPTDFDALLGFLWPTNGTSIIPASARAVEPSQQAMRDLSGRLYPFFVRTRKDELGLEDPLLHVEECEMKPLQAEIYDHLKTRMRRAVKAGAGERVQLGRLGEIVMYLLEAAVNPALLAPAVGGSAKAPTWPPRPATEDSPVADLIRNYSELEVPIKFDKIATQVAANHTDGKKTLVWTNFVANFDALDKLLKPFEPAKIHGAVPPSADPSSEMITRDSELARFRGDRDCGVLIANPAAMSEGVSLHDVCHDAIYADRTFNAGQYLQSLDRIHRLGLKRGITTNITFLACRGTIDEGVASRVEVKATRLGELLSDPNLVTMALPDEEDQGEWIDPEDSDVLFAHLA